MQLENTTSTTPHTPATAAADEAHRVIANKARDVGAQQIASLGEGFDEDHVKEHIRGMVAATMANLSIHATDVAIDHARHWQRWALGIADGIESPAVTLPLVR